MGEPGRAQALDHSIVAATLPPVGGTPELHRIENTERAICRFIGRLGGPDGLAVSYEAGPCGFDLLRLLSRLGVAWSPLIATPADWAGRSVESRRPWDRRRGSS